MNLQGELQHVVGQLGEMEKQLDKARADVAERDQLLEDIRHSLKCSQDELRNRNREVEELDQALKERQWELHHRAAQVRTPCGLFTLSETDTESKNIRTKCHGNLCCHLSLSSMNTTAQSYVAHFLSRLGIGLSVGECKHTIRV